MKKLLAFGMGLITLSLVLILAIFAIMHTPYLTPCAQWLTAHLWPGRLTFTQLDYQYPRHFTLHDVTLQSSSQPLHIQQVDIWLNARPRQEDKWIIDSLLLEGANLSDGLPATPVLSELQLHQLALHNFDIASGDLIARGLNLQVKQPVWRHAHQSLPFGQLQLSADQFYWQGEALNDVLVDANYQTQDSTIYGASFEWRGGQFSGQAEQYPQGWSLVNVTINQLNLDQDINQLNTPLWPLLRRYVNRINSLDILHSNLHFAGGTLTNLALSAENLQLDRSWWQQNQGYLSLNADAIDWRGLQWTEPTFKLDFGADNIHISDFAADVLQGSLQLSGTLTPDSLHLRRLTARGLKWFGEHDRDWQWLSTDLSALRTVKIDQFDLHNLQLIQLQRAPLWQLSGLNAEGRATQLMHDGQWGLWQGHTSLSVNNASIGSLLTSQAIVEMHSENGQWSLDRAFLPLQQGYLDARAHWNFSAESAPWQISVHADGLALNELQHWIPLPFKLQAVADFDLNAEGLAGDYSMFAHSLSGELEAGLRAGIFSIQQPGQLVIQPFSADDIHLSADRGRLTLQAPPLSGPGLKARIQGSIDLVNPAPGTLILDLIHNCYQTRFDLLRNQQTRQRLTANECAD